MDIRLYIKFGAKEHLEKMQKQGLFYCNTITFFSKLEDENRGDPFESVSSLRFFENAVMKLRPQNDVNAEWKKLRIINGNYKEYYENPLGNLFCMSAFKINPTENIQNFNFDVRFQGFEFCLLILDQKQFMKRLKKALDKLDIKVCLKLVEYNDLNKYTGPKTLFQKDLKYSWQEEFRIILYTDKFEINDPYTFSIGSIEDISEIFDLKRTKYFQYNV